MEETFHAFEPPSSDSATPTAWEEPPLVVSFVAPREEAASLIAGTLFLLIVFVPALWWPWFLSLGVAYVPLAASMFWQAWRCRRLAGLGVVVDDEGIGPASGEHRLWVLPWSNYGGYRATSATIGERLRRPERTGYEILDRSGQVVFGVPIWSGGPRNAAVVALRQELRRRTPSDGFPYESRVNGKPRREFVVGSAGAGLLLAGLAAWGLHQPIVSSSYVVGILATILSPAAFVAALIEVDALRRKAAPRPVPALPPLPEEGPILERHLARRGKEPILLKEGGRYRTVEPERRRKELRAGAKGAWLVPVGAALAALYAGFGIADPRMLPIAALGVLFWAGMTLGVGISAAGCRRLLGAVDDVLWVHDDRLVVVRARGEPLSLPLPTGTYRQALRRKARTGVTDTWRLPDGTRYAIDRTRLYEAPIPTMEKNHELRGPKSA